MYRAKNLVMAISGSGYLLIKTPGSAGRHWTVGPRLEPYQVKQMQTSMRHAGFDPQDHEILRVNGMPL